MFLRLLVTITVLTAGVELLKLPSYITPCKLSDPAFEKCAVSTANNFFQKLTDGDKALSIPPLGQAKFPILYLNNSGDVSVTITDVSLSGLDKVKFLSLKKIPSKNRIEGALTLVPTIVGHFDINSKVDGVAVVGSGPGVWKISEITVNIAFDWLVKERDGVKYIEVTNFVPVLHTKGAELTIEVKPGNNLNELLKKTVNKITEEALPKGGIFYMKLIFTMLTQALFTSVPYNEVFLE